MTFIYKHDGWMEDYMTCYDVGDRKGNVELKYFCCEMVVNKKNRDEVEPRQRKKKRIKLECQEQLARLSRPKKIFQEINPLKTNGAPLEKLLPRLCRLSEPKIVTPKYKKPKEEPYPLPGKVKNWEAHKQWLAARAKPKRDYQKFHQQLYEASSCSIKITQEGLHRIFSLARPKKKSICHRLRPRSGFHMRPTFANERICKLSKPRAQYRTHCEIYPMSCPLRVSKSALVYKPSERIKSLAVPRNQSHRQHQDTNKCNHCYRSISCDDVLFKERRYDLRTA